MEKRLGNFYALVGYSEPVRVGVGWFEFTIYWLKDYDRGVPGAEHGTYSKGGFPSEAILVSDLMKENVRKVEPTTEPKVAPLRCPICNHQLQERKSVGGYVCKHWECKNYWKLGRGPVFLKEKKGSG